jgi:hypothetical protein
MGGEREQGGGRFRDPAERLWRFAQEILVRCPRCNGRAVVVVHPNHREGPRNVVVWLVAPRRLSCPGCGYTDEWLPRPAARGDRDWLFTKGGPFAVPYLSGPDDPYFGLPLWLQRPCCGGRVLWAYNAAHLEFLERYVAARLRERHPYTGSGSLVERLPAWIKAARNRDEVLAAIHALRMQA